MKSKIIYAVCVFGIIGCIALSYFAVAWYGDRFVGTLYPMDEISYTIPPQAGDEQDLETVLRVFAGGEKRAETTVTADEVETFALMDQVHEQIALLSDCGVLSGTDYANAHPATLERYALDGYPDAYVWTFVFADGGETLAIYYHLETEKIIRLEIGGSENYTAERLDEIKQAYAAYFSDIAEDADVNVVSADNKIILQVFLT